MRLGWVRDGSSRSHSWVKDMSEGEPWVGKESVTVRQSDAEGYVKMLDGVGKGAGKELDRSGPGVEDCVDNGTIRGWPEVGIGWPKDRQRRENSWVKKCRGWNSYSSWSGSA